MPRVLFDHVIFARVRVGGVLRYITRLVENLLDAPERVQVELFRGLYLSEYPIEELDRLARHQGIALPVKSRVRRLFETPNRLLYRRFAEQSKADLIHLTSYFDPAPAARGKRVVTLHDLISERLQSRFRRSLDPFYGADVIRSGVAKADGVICISENTKRDAIELLGVPAEKCSVIYHGVDLAPVQKPIRLVDKPYLLYVGARGLYKNDICLLKAWRDDALINQEFDLLFFGGGPCRPGELDTLPQAIHGRIHFQAGDDQKLASAYQNAAALVYPSHYEGFGLPLVEAMRCGCPVVASKTSCLPEIGSDAALYFNPDSQEELTHAIHKVIENSELRTRLIHLGHARSQEFSWQKTSIQTMNFYDRVLKL